MTERFISPCPKPTPHECELLEILIEECAEVQQRATKMLRFGVNEVQPGQPDNNSRRLALEVGDLMYMMGRVFMADLISAADVAEGQRRKQTQLAKYMQTVAP